MYLASAVPLLRQHVGRLAQPPATSRKRHPKGEARGSKNPSAAHSREAPRRRARRAMRLPAKIGVDALNCLITIRAKCLKP